MVTISANGLVGRSLQTAPFSFWNRRLLVWGGRGGWGWRVELCWEKVSMLVIPDSSTLQHSWKKFLKRSGNSHVYCGRATRPLISLSAGFTRLIPTSGDVIPSRPNQHPSPLLHYNTPSCFVGPQERSQLGASLRIIDRITVHDIQAGQSLNNNVANK